MKLAIKLFFILLIVNLFAKTSVIGNYKTFKVISPHKSTLYYIIEPSERIKFKLSDYSVIYIRAIIKKNIPSYYFKIYYGGNEKTYKRKIKPSKKVRGEKGEKISTLTKITPKTKFIIITNISDLPLLIRIKERYKNTKFVAITPSKFGNIKNINIKSKLYPYFLSDDKIILSIKGRAVLKIISRNTLQKDYSYTIYLDDKKLVTEYIKYKSSNFVSDKNISRGSVKIYQIPKGKHRILIKSDKNVIFRFFINEKAVRLTK